VSHFLCLAVNEALLIIRFWIEFAELKMFGKDRSLQKVS